ncbi:uncharacterized protein LOC105831207 [Monomorium pharaonis]|uniref:uncharacterized protein LOC105831207 n=1 Tax=Monomorium pharaonis TaxID=307658 RepID=UPI0017470A02|nr:uncharacterized protein LOC105831207 [Monomorium pharaonis]XP_036145905.1 uncharacterized protein LOC105831207 [Monomorium pharaonis]
MKTFKFISSAQTAMSRSGIFVLVLWSLMMTTCSFGFTMDRSVKLVPLAWDTAPSLDTYQRVDPALKDKIQTTSTDKISKVENAKMPESMSENRTREKKSTTENVGSKLIEIKPIDEIASAMMNDAPDSSEGNANAIITPRNVILLLIDERGRDEKLVDENENSWKDYKERLPFAIEGFLQSCRNKIESPNFHKDNASVSEKEEKNCDCDVSRSIIEGKLLSWARQARGMTIGTVSGNNFPFFPKYKSSGYNESNAELELYKRKRDSNDSWQVIDLGDRPKSISPLIAIDPKTRDAPEAEKINHDDAAWNMFDLFSKIRMAFFRSLFELLRRNGEMFKDELLPHKPFALTPATNLIEKTFRDLKSVPNDKGYMLIASVPRSEGAAAIDLLEREVSLKDTLLIVTQICAGNQSSVPFVAQGPNKQILQEARFFDELPDIIKKAMIANDCHDIGCTNRQKRVNPIVSHMSTGEIFPQDLPARMRITRNKNVEKPVNSSS